jgi:hypothetical protein
MSQADADVLVVDWLNGLTDPQSRALAHQVGITGAVTYPIAKLRKQLGERKTFKKVKKVYEEHYV